MALLEIKDIHKSFGNLHVLKGIDLTVNKGDVIAILGPSGSGKTTLLRCINYLETADLGTMVFKNQSYQIHQRRKLQILESIRDLYFKITIYLRIKQPYKM